MSWLSDPGAIEHIAHFWQPQDNWISAAPLYSSIMMDFACQLISPHSRVMHDDRRIRWSVKIDDGISLKIGRNDLGHIGVAYKTRSNELLTCDEEIDTAYPDSPHVAWSLKHLLSIKEQFSEIDHEVLQIGMIHPTYNNREQDFNGSYKPNVITYKISPKPGVKAVVNLAAVTRKHPVQLVQDHSWIIGDGIQVIDNTAMFAPLNDIAVNNVWMHTCISSVNQQISTMIDDGHFEVVSGYEADMRMFLNHLVKIGLSNYSLDYLQFVSFMDDRNAVACAALKTEKGRAERTARWHERRHFIHANPRSFSEALYLCHELKNCRDIVLRLASKSLKLNFECDPMPEGLVVSIPMEYGKMALFKFVSEEFTVMNHVENDLV